MTEKDISLVRRELFKQPLVALERSDCDEGLVLIFENGFTLDIGYSGSEGRTIFNNRQLPE